MYGFLIKVFKLLDRCHWFSIDEMYDLAIYASYAKYLDLNWKDTKRILRSIYKSIDKQSYQSIDEFRQNLTAEELRVFNAYSVAESTHIRECVRFLAGEN